MSHAKVASEEPIRERAYVALLLLVGGAAVAVGLYQVARSNASSLSAVLDLSLGASVLMVTWLFLAPAAIPSFFGDPTASDPPVERAYLVAAPTPPPPVERPGPIGRPHSRPDPIIPKWADPLVGPKVAAAAPAAGVAAAAELPAKPDVVEPPREPLAEIFPLDDPAPYEPPEPVRSVPRAPSVQSRSASRWEEEGPTYAEDRGGPLDVLKELDRIEAELRAFAPHDSDPSAAGGSAYRDSWAHP